MKNTSAEIDKDGMTQDGTVIPPAASNFDIGCFYRLEYYQNVTNARGIQSYFLYFKKQMTEKEKMKYCLDLCERNMWRLVNLVPAAQIVE